MSTSRTTPRLAVTTLALVTLLIGFLIPLPADAQTEATGADVVIGQVYGGGGNSGAPYTHDFVELFNRGDVPVDLGGLSVQYASATGTGNFGATASQLTELPAVTLQPGQYYLVQQAGGTNGVPLPTPDLIDPTPIAMAAGAGKVVLAEGISSLGCNGGSTACSPEQLERIIDLVGYGGANFFEGSAAAPTLSNSTAAFRADDGCTDTDDNAADFTSATPAPRNTSTPLNPCGGALGPIAVISQVYGGGGNSGAPYTHDFVELFNRGDVPVDLGGLSVQYASATGTGNFGATASQLTELPAVTLQPGQYYLVQQAGGTNGVPLPTPDLIDPTPIAMAAGAGKVVLAEGISSLGCNGGSTACSPEQLERIIDLVGYGGANFFEGSAAAPTLSNSTAAFRADDGCTDTDDNAADFTSATPAPRNTSTPLNPCGGGGPAPNAPIVPSCANLTVDEGQPGSVEVSARDADGTVTSAELTTTIDGVTLTEVVPAGGIGETLTATLGADDTLAVGTYTATIEFTNDDEDPQSATCDVTVNVRPDPCDTPTLISDINTVGSNGLPNTSKWSQRLGVEAIVTADFQDGLNGFFVQEEDADWDGDETTSEGIFVYAPAADEAPEVGSLVCVVGTVGSFSGTYQLTNVRVEVLDSDQPLPTAVQVKLPVDDRVELARIAGMRTELTGQDGTLTIAQNYFQGQYGELDLSGAGRLWNPTELYSPDDPRAAELRDFNIRSQIKLDDANSTTNATPVPWIDNGSTRAGAETFEPIEGIVHYQFSSFRIQPTAADDITFTNTENPRPTDAPNVSPSRGDVRHGVTVASFNVLNYFTTLTSESDRARGADTAEEFELQAAKIVTAITKMDADVVGLMEIENNFGEDGDALADLVSRLNAVAGEGTYAAIALHEPVGTDAISNAMIYKPATVTPVGGPAIADHDAFVNPLEASLDRNRPAIAQAFESPTGEVFIAVVNHLKSKGSGCGAADPAVDLSGNCNLTRTLAAEELVRWLNEDDPTGTGSDQVAIIGDLNAYAMEDPIDVLRDAGYVDALADQLGEAYSYVFDGELGRLDHGFVSGTLTDNLVAADEWHINADEPAAFDYNDWNDPSVQDTSEFRSSDHDPMLIGLAFDCRNGGWASASPPRFRNQGQCLAAVVAEGDGNAHAGGRNYR
jgi:uncharacterized protein